MSEQHLTDAQPRHPDPGMDSLIRRLEPAPLQPTPEAEAQPEAEVQPIEEAPPVEEVQPEAVEEVAEFDDDPVVTVTVQGVEEEVPLSEVIQGYSRQSDYTRKVQMVAEERRALEAERSQLMLAQREAVERAAGLASRLEAELATTQPNPEDMAKLRMTNPGEYAARVADQQHRQQLLYAAQQQAAALEAQQNGQRIESERAALADKEPAFRDNFDKTYAELGAWVTSPEGGNIPVEDWNQEYDHSRILLAYQAMQRAQQDAATRDGTQKVRATVAKLPRIRSRGVESPGQSEREQYAAAVQKMQRSSSAQDIARALQARNRLLDTNREG